MAEKITESPLRFKSIGGILRIRKRVKMTAPYVKETIWSSNLLNPTSNTLKNF